MHRPTPSPSPSTNGPPGTTSAARLSPATSVRSLPLPTRTRNALLSGAVGTVGQLALCRRDELLRLPNIGHRGLLAIRSALEHAGYPVEEDMREDERKAPGTGNGAGRSRAWKQRIPREPQSQRSGPQRPAA